MTDERLRALERAAAAGDPDAHARLEVERRRSGRRHEYEPDEVTLVRGRRTIRRLREGWVMIPRGLLRSRAHQPPDRLEIVTEWRQFGCQYSPLTIRAVVPQAWWIIQADRLGRGTVDKWTVLSVERRAVDERELERQRRVEQDAWIALLACLEHGPQVLPAVRLAPVRSRLASDLAFRVEVVGSRVVVGRTGDARYDTLLAEACARSARARQAAETRRQRGASSASTQTRVFGSRPPDARPSRPRPPRDETTARRWVEALERLRGVVASGDGLAIGSTPELRRVMGLPTTAAASELLAALRDGLIPEAADLYCTRNGPEWLVVTSWPR